MGVLVVLFGALLGALSGVVRALFIVKSNSCGPHFLTPALHYSHLIFLLVLSLTLRAINQWIPPCRNTCSSLLGSPLSGSPMPMFQ
ncbi:exported hypothetical protein [Candidatus Propionivibrio aalborgensis]|uniref:Uncharacterized protein n=1 Tax=Candidatus Propionivibrio aalborgensis TaxID=1860101 RepID=A0A1A8XID0_9RHOO|nr:exported hypothetical protein [Candidatus Propionivibrio aalborgensis]